MEMVDNARSDGSIEITQTKKQREKKSKINKNKTKRKNRTSKSCGIRQSNIYLIGMLEKDVRERMGKRYLKK